MWKIVHLLSLCKSLEGETSDWYGRHNEDSAHFTHRHLHSLKNIAGNPDNIETDKISNRTDKNLLSVCSGKDDTKWTFSTNEWGRVVVRKKIQYTKMWKYLKRLSHWSKTTEYRSGTVNSNTVNSKFHLIRSYCEYLVRILSFHV